MLADQSRVVFADLSLHPSSVFKAQSFRISKISGISHVLPEVCHAIVCIFTLSDPEVFPALSVILIEIVAECGFFMRKLINFSCFGTRNAALSVTRGASYWYSDILTSPPINLRLDSSLLCIIG